MGIPEKRAADIIETYGLESPGDINLGEIANAEQLIIENQDLTGCLGKISFTREYGLIKIDSKIREPGQKRFCIGHEMGHFFNERTLRNLQTYQCTADDLFSFKVNKRREDDANLFSSELLMFTPWFQAFVAGKEPNAEVIKEAAGYFGVSLTAAAIRYAKIGPEPMGVLLSRNGRLVWSSFSPDFPLQWIPGGYEVSKDSAVYDFFAGREMQTCSDLIPAYAWFAEDYNCREDMYLYEQSVAMRRYDSVLTLLWMSEFS